MELSDDEKDSETDRRNYASGVSSDEECGEESDDEWIFNQLNMNVLQNQKIEFNDIRCAGRARFKKKPLLTFHVGHRQTFKLALSLCVNVTWRLFQLTKI